jgi:uncharacterized membrane protein
MKESIKLYKVTIGIFIFLSAFLIFVNIIIVRNMNLKMAVKTSYSNKPMQMVKKYGYFDVLSIINKYKVLRIEKINNSPNDKGLVAFDIYYQGDLQTLNTILEDLKKEGCFVEINNIKIKKSIDEAYNVSLVAEFIKNK